MANVECDILSEETFPLEGAARTVLLARVQGKSRALDRFAELDGNQVAQVGALLSRASDHWPILNREICKQVEGPIYELKRGQVRIFFYEKDNCLVLLDAVIKKARFLRPQDVKRAKEVMEQFEAEFDWITMNHKEAR